MRQVFTPNLRRILNVSFISAAGYYCFSSFLSPYLRSSGVPVVAVGLFFSLCSAFEAPSSFAGGVLGDRVGRRPLIVAGRVLRSLGWMTAILWPTTAGLLASAVLLGLNQIALGPYRALIAESAAPGRRAAAFAIVSVVENIGALTAPPLVGVVAARLGMKPVLVAVAVLTAVAVVIFAARIRETLGPAEFGGQTAGDGEFVGDGESAAAARPAAGGTTRPAAHEGLRYVVSREGRGALVIGLMWLVGGIGNGLIPPIWGLYVTDRFGLGYAGLGAVSMSLALGAGIGQLIGGFVADRIGHARFLVAGLIVSAPCWALVTLAGEPWLFSVLAFLTYLAACVAGSAWEAIGVNAVPRRLRASVAGLYGVMNSVGAMAGASLGTLAYASSIFLPWFIMAGGDLLLLALAVIGQRAAARGFAPPMANSVSAKEWGGTD